MFHAKDEFQKDAMEAFVNRLTELRMAKNISARSMSLALGHNKNYINSIESKKTLPSLIGFYEICFYLQIDPKDFYDTDYKNPGNTNKLEKMFKQLPPEYAKLIQSLMEGLIKSTN